MNKTKKVVFSLIIASLLTAVASGRAYATINYGGGETEIINKRFSIEKEVAKVDEDDWDDWGGDWEDEAEDELDFHGKVTDVEDDDVVIFRIKIENLTSSDDTDDIDIDFDNMKMHDILPDELYRVGGSGLTEYWDDFEPDEDETFYIVAKIDEDEFDRDDEFEKCVVNKAKVYWDGEFEGSDTATVCYDEIDEEVTELPETGAPTAMGIVGAGMIMVGVVSGIKGRKKNKYFYLD